MESLKGNRIPQFINEYQKVEIFSVFDDDTCNRTMVSLPKISVTCCRYTLMNYFHEQRKAYRTSDYLHASLFEIVDKTLQGT